MKIFLFFVRCAMALVWLYNGLWLKVLAWDASHRSIVAAAIGGSDGMAEGAMVAIGLGETLLAIGIVTGFTHRFVNIFQIILLITMNVAGTLPGGVERPIGLLIGNLPLVCCAALVAIFGPGAFAISIRNRGT